MQQISPILRVGLIFLLIHSYLTNHRKKFPPRNHVVKKCNKSIFSDPNPAFYILCISELKFMPTYRPLLPLRIKQTLQRTEPLFLLFIICP